MFELLAIALLTLGSSASGLYPRDDGTGGGLNVTTLSKSINATGGTGQVAAGGTLEPFGGVGVGCGINWNANDSYGGGLQAGSKDFGLGGGANITPDKLYYGAGIGLNTVNATANFMMNATTNGTFGFKFESTEKFACTGKLENGTYSIDCCSV